MFYSVTSKGHGVQDESFANEGEEKEEFHHKTRRRNKAGRLWKLSEVKDSTKVRTRCWHEMGQNVEAKNQEKSRKVGSAAQWSLGYSKEQSDCEV